MKKPRPVTVDFETFGIEGRPRHPPVPVGVSIKYPGRKARYFGWGHVDGNNCTWPEARMALEAAWKHPDGVLFQNGKFDVDVAEVHFGIAPPPWDKIHDTMFLLFLDDPHQLELGLKKSAERLLDWPAEERDEVVDWLVEHQPVPGVRVSKARNSDHYAMKYLAFAPGDLVGRYANGDSDRTEALFDLLWAKTRDRAMLGAYDVERELMLYLLDMERQGVPVDLARLRRDVATYELVRARVDQWVIQRVRAPEDINLNSGAQLVAAMLAAGVVDEDALGVTPKTGKPRTDKDSLMGAVSDKQLLAMLRYRAQLATCLDTFMTPWLLTAERSGGLIYTHWNQTKAPSGDANVGTRTGRLSSTPNFQNLPKEFAPTWRHEEKDPRKAKLLPACPLRDLPSLPRCRSYITPFPGDDLIDRDYSQQEPRILAHFDGGDLLETYLANPWIDFHDYAKVELEVMGLFYDRRPVKNTNLGLIYGMGVGKLAEKNGMSVAEAKTLKEAILRLYPGLKAMYEDMKTRAAQGTPIRTWGGREYYCEKPRYDEDKRRWVQFDYKLVNVLIQGSAADCTKAAIINFYRAKKKAWKLLLNVHDQLTASVPRREVKAAMECLRVAMESVEFDVPMLSEGSTSSTHWDDLTDYDKKGKRI